MLPLRILALLSLLLLDVLSYGQVKKPAFTVSSSIPDLSDSALIIKCKECPVYHVNDGELYSYLQKAPHIDRVSNIENQGLSIELPEPNGSVIRYSIVRYDMMENGLQKLFPTIMTFLGKGSDGSNIRADYTSHGFKAWVIGNDVNYMIEPLTLKDKSLRVVLNNHDKDKTSQIKDLIPTSDYSSSNFNTAFSDGVSYPAQQKGINSFTNVRKYRLAVLAFGDFINNFGGTAFDALSSIIDYVNRLNLILERDLGVSLTIVANNHLIVSENAISHNFIPTGPNYTYEATQYLIDSLIGFDNYDIGHFFMAYPNILSNAERAVVCNVSSKAKAYTYFFPNDPYFSLLQLAKIIAYQFGASNTFNSNTLFCGWGRDSLSAYEIGNGNTLLSALYQISCPETQYSLRSDPYFHFASIKQMREFIETGSGSMCGQNVLTNNHKPIVIANDTVFIPPNTPFTLTAIGSDPDPYDTLTYCWEQFDLGPPNSVNIPLTPNSPRFRSYPPIADPARTFPAFNHLLENSTANSEFLPDQPTQLTFKVTLRDNAVYGAAIDTATTIVNVHGSDPFHVVFPNEVTDVWQGGTQQAIRWNAANTATAPFNCLYVKILLSTDGGITWPYELNSLTTNDGVDTVLVPALSSKKCRVMVKGIDQVFFDISNYNFTITKPSFPHYSIIPPQDTLYLCISDSIRVPIYTRSEQSYAMPLYISPYVNNQVITLRLEEDTILPGDTIFLWVKASTFYFHYNHRIAIYINSTAGDQYHSFVLRSVFAPPGLPGTISQTYFSSLFKNPVIEWDQVINAEHYEFEIIDPQSSNTIISYNNIRDTYKYLDINLADNGLNYYYLKLRAVNSCGYGPWSNFIYIYYNPYINCQTLQNDSIKAIPDLGKVDYYFDVPTMYISASIKNLKGFHQKFQDLSFEFGVIGERSPLFNFTPQCELNSTQFNLSFSDYASERSYSCKEMDSTIIKVDGNNLNNFPYLHNCNTLKLSIEDLATGGSGEIFSVQLEVCSISCPTPSLQLLDLLEVPIKCEGDSIVLQCLVDSLDFLNYMTYRWLRNGEPVSDKIVYNYNIRANDTLKLNLPEISMADTGSYQLEQLGCCNQAISNSIRLEALPRPTKPELTRLGDSLFCSTQSNNLWYLNDSFMMGYTGNAIYIQDTGTYSVIHFQNGCNSLKSSLRITALRIGEGILSDYQIYPNPFNDEIHLEYTGAYDSLSQGEPIAFNMIDYLGRSVFQTELTQKHQKQSIRIPDLSSGLYFIMLQNAGKRKVFKLLKRKD